MTHDPLSLFVISYLDLVPLQSTRSLASTTLHTFALVTTARMARTVFAQSLWHRPYGPVATLVLLAFWSSAELRSLCSRVAV